MALFESLHVKSRVGAKVLYYCCIIFLILFAGTRQVGFDLDIYKTIFGYAASSDFWNAGIEIGFAFLCHLFSTLGFNAFIFFVALSAVLLFSRFFTKYSPYFFLSLLLYFSSYYIVKEMGQMRQGLAMAVSTISFVAAFQKQRSLYIVCTIIAMSIHYSAIVLIPVYYLCNHPLKSEKMLIILIASTLFLIVNLNILLSHSLSLLPFTAMQQKAADVLLAAMSEKKMGFGSSLILRGIIFGIMISYRQRLNSIYPFFDKLLMLYFYGLLLFIVFNSISEFAQRTSVYFRLLEVIIIPCILQLVRQRFARLAIVLILILNSFISINRLFSTNNGYETYNPYSSFLVN